MKFSICLVICLAIFLSQSCVLQQPSQDLSLGEKIIVDFDEKSALEIGKDPSNDKNFQKSISALNGRSVHSLVDLRQILKIVKPRPFTGGLKVVDLSNDLIFSALQTGHIINANDMRYHLQVSREFEVQTLDDTVTVGIYYKPVGYIRFRNEESYWFLFGTNEDVDKPKRDK